MNDMTLYLIIALVPLAGSLIAGLFGNKIGRAGAHTVTILGVAVSAVLSAYVLWGFIDGSRAKFDENVYTWLTMGGLDFSVGFFGRYDDGDDDGRGHRRIADGTYLHHRLYAR